MCPEVHLSTKLAAATAAVNSKPGCERPPWVVHPANLVERDGRPIALKHEFRSEETRRQPRRACGSSIWEATTVSRLCSVLTGSACRAVVQCLPHAVVLLDEQRRGVIANRAALQLLRVPSRYMRGISFDTLVPESNLDLLLGDFRDRRQRGMEISRPSIGGNRV